MKKRKVIHKKSAGRSSSRRWITAAVLIVLVLIIAYVGVMYLTGKAVVTRPTIDYISCKDSDGRNAATPGSVQYIYRVGNAPSKTEIKPDACYLNTWVTEWYCQGKSPKNYRQRCTGTCAGGFCVPAILK